MKALLLLLVALGLMSISLALAGEQRGVWIEGTPCASDEILEPDEYRPRHDDEGADAWYVCTQAEDYAISLIRTLEASHDSVTCFIVSKRPRHWYRHHGLKIVATEMCHH